MTADRARLRELLAEHAKASCQYHFDCEPCGASGLVAALPALLDALDEAEKALREAAEALFDARRAFERDGEYGHAGDAEVAESAARDALASLAEMERLYEEQGRELHEERWQHSQAQRCAAHVTEAHKIELLRAQRAEAALAAAQQGLRIVARTAADWRDRTAAGGDETA